jgi:hypothetical protein
MKAGAHNRLLRRCRPTAALGQTRRLAPQPVTFGLPPINGHRQTGPTGLIRTTNGFASRAGLRNVLKVTDLTPDEL